MRSSNTIERLMSDMNGDIRSHFLNDARDKMLHNEWRYIAISLNVEVPKQSQT